MSDGNGKLRRIKGGKSGDVNLRLEMQEKSARCSSGSKHPVCRSSIALCPPVKTLPLVKKHTEPKLWAEACLENDAELCIALLMVGQAVHAFWCHRKQTAKADKASR